MKVQEMMRGIMAQHAANWFEVARQYDPSRAGAGPGADYGKRNAAVWTAAGYAAAAGLAVGMDFDPHDPVHPVVLYVELPTGQVSWHLPAHSRPYDGHSTAEKYERLADWLTAHSVADGEPS